MRGAEQMRKPAPMAAPALRFRERAIVDAIRREARPLTGDVHDYDALLARIGDARIVVLGEASHGTHEFVRERARITKRLICERGFTAIAIDGDCADAQRVDRFIRGTRTDRDAEQALRGFERVPWRSAEMLELVDWLRMHNEGLHPSARKVGFYGLDGSNVASWNLRERHLADMFDQLLADLDRHGGTARVIVWAQEINLGQLMRERHADEVVSVGFTTYKRASARSSEALLHSTGIPAFLLCPPPAGDIGEARQFDALVHIDRSRAVEPLD
jgi:erythromycin esterase-like protein